MAILGVYMQDIIPDAPDESCKNCGKIMSKLFNIQEKKFTGWWCAYCGKGDPSEIVRPIGREHKIQFTGKQK